MKIKRKFNNSLTQITKWRLSKRRLYFGILVIIIILILGYYLFDDKRGFFLNLYTEIMGIIITVLIINEFAKHIETEREKASLILQMGSPHNVIAIEAVRLISAKGWHLDGTLHRVRLNQANLQRASLYKFDMEMAILYKANLLEADLYDCQLQRASLTEATLTEASLEKANLQHADLSSANLQKANLCGTDLRGADLENSILVDAIFDDHTKFNNDTILPDGTRWRNTNDLEKFVKHIE